MKKIFSKFFTSEWFKPLVRGGIFGLGIFIGLATMNILSVTVGTLNTFSPGTPLSSSQINQNFTTLKTAIEALNTEVLAVIPAGTILSYGGNTAPSGFLLCNGTAISRSSYPALFAVIGTAFGAPDGSSFNVPDFRGRFLRGLDGTAGIDPDKSSRIALNGGNTGNAIGSYQDDELRSHNHGFMPNNGFSPGSCWWDGTGGAGSCNVPPTNYVMSHGGSETRPKNVYVNYIIKY